MMSNDKNKPDTKQRDPDLISAEIAMKRAALKAREIAEKTGTAIVTSDNEIIRKEYPNQRSSSQ